MLLCATGLAGAGEGAAEMLSLVKLSEEDGADVDMGWTAGVTLEGRDGMSMAAFIDALGTPHSAHTSDPEDVSPMGFRLLQTSHSHVSTFVVDLDAWLEDG